MIMMIFVCCLFVCFVFCSLIFFVDLVIFVLFDLYEIIYNIITT